MANRASMLDVARRAGFSRTTVSYVLNERKDVAIPEGTRSQILRVAREMGYRPNGIARSLVRNRTHTVGVILPSLDSSFHAEIVNGIQRECMRREYRLLLSYSSDDAEKEYEQARLLLEHRAEGVICVTSEHTCEHAEAWVSEVLDEGGACVLVDHRLPSLQVDCVLSDDASGTRQVMEHLLRLGHRRIAHLSGGPLASPSVERCLGYRAALEAAGIPVDERLIAGHSFNDPCVDRWIEQFLTSGERPTALFAANDDLAAEALLALERRGLRVPADIALAGYGDQRMAGYLRLTTVDQSPRDMGRRAAERLFHRIEEPGLPAEGIQTPTQLVVRESTTGAGLDDSTGSVRCGRIPVAAPGEAARPS